MLACVCSTTRGGATDIWGVRLGTAGAFAPGQSAAALPSLGGNYEAFINGWGVRLGVDLGAASYTLGGRKDTLILAPEVAYYRGRDGAVMRTYWLGQLILAPRSEVLEGFRLGPEIEWRDICESNLRVALGLFYQPLRERESMNWMSGGMRVTIAWGKPTSGCVEEVGLDELPGRVE